MYYSYLSFVEEMMQRKKILIIDDEPDILEILQIILEEEGYVTQTAGDDRHLDHLLSFQPDLILLDISLSGADGREISKLLKGQSTTKDIPIVLMSAHGRATQAECGADGFLAKPFEIDVLLTTIRQYI